MFNVIVRGITIYISGILTVILILRMKEMAKTNEDVWNVIGNFLGHVIALEITVAIIVFVARFVLRFLGIM